MTQTQGTSIPYNGSGTINIHINNPSANLNSGMPSYAPMAYPVMPYPCYCYPPSYYMGYGHGGITQTTNINAPYGFPAGNSQGNIGASKNVDNLRNVSSVTNTVQTQPEKKKEREIVVLTDNYIKNLENYLRSNNKQLRQDAVKELLMRFKEDKSRIDNPSLTALLNIALQDINASVRAVAMSIIQSGYAKGDDLTAQLLAGIQNTKKAYSTDATQASDSLLQMSKTKMKVQDNSHYLDQPQTQKKGK